MNFFVDFLSQLKLTIKGTMYLWRLTYYNLVTFDIYMFFSSNMFKIKNVFSVDDKFLIVCNVIII